MADNGKVHTWVENQVESGQVVGLRFSVARPRIVQDLLEATPRPHFGSSGLLLAPEAIPPQLVTGLVEHLRLEGRELPMIVVSQPPTDDGGTWLSRATRIANRVMGVANVVTLNQEATARFREILGRLATDDGNVRVYAPVPIVEGEGHLHKYTTWPFFIDSSSERRSINRIVYAVCTQSTQRRPDSAFEVFSADASDQKNRTNFTNIQEIVNDLESKLRATQEELESVKDELNKTSAELNFKTGHLDRLHQILDKEKLFELYYQTEYNDGSGIPDDTDSIEIAIIQAEDYLSDWLVIHENAPPKN